VPPIDFEVPADGGRVSIMPNCAKPGLIFDPA
jgi:hypothetical protein